MKKRLIYTLLAGCASVLASIASAQVTAGDAQPPAATGGPTNDGPSAGVADIIVTAQRRSQNLISVPLSISAVTGRTLTETGIKSLGELAVKTPGVAAYTGYAHNQVFIRGIGNTVFNGADPSVATFVDDVPRPYGMTHSTFVNVERVEILKGAQGGLYGRNATAGVINIITRQPSDKLSAEGRVSYGTRDTFNAQAYLNVPLTDHVAWNVSVQRLSHPPYSKNLVKGGYYTAANFPVSLNPGITPQQQQAAADLLNTGFRPPKGRNDQNFWAIDSKLRFQVADNFKITLMGDWLRERSAGGTAVRNVLPQQNVGLASTLIRLRVGPAR